VDKDRLVEPISEALNKDEMDALKEALLPWNFAFDEFKPALKVACRDCAVNCVRFLLLNGTEPDKGVMNAAIEGGNREIIALISRIVFDKPVWERDETKWKCTACEKWDFEVLEWLIRTREGGMNQDLLSVAMKSRDLVTVMLLLDRDIAITQELRIWRHNAFHRGMREVFSKDLILYIILTLNAIFVDFVRWKMPDVELLGTDFASNVRSIVEAGKGLWLAEMPFCLYHYHGNQHSLSSDVAGWEMAPQRTALFEAQLRTTSVHDAAVCRKWEWVTAVCAIEKPNGFDTAP
jgi:hypothetical protein